MLVSGLSLSGEFVNLVPLAIDYAELTLSWRLSDRAGLLNRGATTLEEQVAWIENRPASEFNFIIETKEHRPVGMISLVEVDEKNCRAESARFLIGDEEAVKGLPVAVEAMKLLYELAFEKLGLIRVYGTVASANTLMIKWQKYLGMKEEGRLRSHYLIQGKAQDAVCLGILAEEFTKVARPKMNSLIGAARHQQKFLKEKEV